MLEGSSGLMALCTKCKQFPLQETDTWCLGCSSWESLGIELCGTWHHEAIRAVACDQVLACVRGVRNLRNLSGSLRGAEASRASSRGAERALPSRPLPGTAKPPHPALPPRVKREEEHSDSEEEEESEEEEKDREEEDEGSPKAKSKAVKPAAGDSSRGRSDKRADPRPRGDRAEERDRAGERSRTPVRRRRRDRPRRGGRKHSRTYRQIDNPLLRVHRRLSAAFLETRPTR